MEKLFGIPMGSIMLALVALFAVAVAGVGAIYLTSRHMFLMGLRNVPRRGAQTGLVIVGLTLATLIATAAFATGDTVDYSIGRAGYDQLQRIDLQLNLIGEDTVNADTAVYFPERAAPKLEQRFAGDQDIEGFIPLLLEPASVVDKRSAQSEPSITLSGIDPERQANLGGLRRTAGGPADLALGPDEILLSKRAAEKLDARAGDVLTVYAGGASRDLKVVDIVEDEVASSGAHAFYQKGSGGAAMPLSTLQELTGHRNQINFLGVALKGTVAASHLRSNSVISRLEPFLQSDEGLGILGTSGPVSVDAVKSDAVKNAEETGNLFTTFFLVLGLFSIAAGVMLIFMIFVMLAAERKPEMGMARAVGAQRSSLVQAFLSEGMAYSLIAGAVGAAIGVAAAVGLVAGFLKIAGGFDFIHAHVTLRSLVVSYCLGVVVTFLTVLFSAMKVSSVNIVSAIRGTEEDQPKQPARHVSWRWVLAGIPALVVPPLGLWFLLRKGFGVSWAWIMAPVGVALGLLSIVAASSSGSEFLFSFGVSVLPLSAAIIATHYRAPGRLTWTIVGAYLAVYWLAPVDYAKLLLGKHLTGDVEMFVLSGIMVVIAFTLIIVYNARLLTGFFQSGSGSRYLVSVVLLGVTTGLFAGGLAVGDGAEGLGQLLYMFGGVVGIGAALAFVSAKFPQFAPALKMGVAYPLSNRFRTGMTIAMFSLIVFSLATFSAINHSFVALLTADGGDGGWDVMTTANRTSGVDNIRGALNSAGAPVAGDIAATGRVSIFDGHSQVRAPSGDYKAFPVLVADDGYFDMEDSKLKAWARGYEDESAVFAAVKAGKDLALVDSSVLPGGFNDYDFQVNDLKITDDRFDPFTLEVRDTSTNRRITVTVVGVLAIQVDQAFTAGVYLPEAAYRPVFGDPQYLRTYVKLAPNVNAKAAARAIEASLVTQGVQADSTRSLLDDAASESNSFIRMFQGFMALGLFTGIAALGVIAYRSVVERRQQIGMLRAIGYQPGTVALSFMFESGFIALMGILSGVVGGMIIAHNFMTSGQLSSEGIKFAIPWTEVLIVAVSAFIASMVMTWWPSRQAAIVPVAEALRYE